MQIENKKAAFKAGLLGALAYLSNLKLAKKLAKIVTWAKFGRARRRRHVHMFGGPAGHTLATKKFVGSRSASRRARNFLKAHNQSPWARIVQTA